MNILILSTQNPFRTSGIVAYDLYKGLKDENTTVKVVVKQYTKFDNDDFISLGTPWDVHIENWKWRWERISKRLGINGKIDRTNPEYHVQDYNQTIQYHSTNSILKEIDFKPDVIIYLFQQNFLTAKNLFELHKKTGAKIIWYLMDTAPMTGACHYSWDCRGFVQGCGACPALYSKKQKDQSAKNLEYKLKYLSQTDIEIIAATEFQLKQAKASYLFKNKPVHKILLSIDPELFSPGNPVQAKEKWGISAGEKVIFCGGTSINNKRKGMKYLVEALEILGASSNISASAITIMVAGNSDLLFQSLPFNVKYVGFLPNNEELASAYRAADVFVCPSIEDAGPMMINQSMMAGTPVVSFEMGVSFDLVLTGQTGYRAKLKDSSDLANGLKTILELDEILYGKMKENCRDLALKLCHPGVFKEKFNLIFNKN